MKLYTWYTISDKLDEYGSGACTMVMGVTGGVIINYVLIRPGTYGAYPTSSTTFIPGETLENIFKDDSKVSQE